MAIEDTPMTVDYLIRTGFGVLVHVSLPLKGGPLDEEQKRVVRDEIQRRLRAAQRRTDG